MPVKVTAQSLLNGHVMPRTPHLYLNSVIWRTELSRATSQKSLKDPWRSGMVVASMASLRAPTPASSVTRRSLSKFMLAPLVTATAETPCIRPELRSVGLCQKTQSVRAHVGLAHNCDS